ncbi:Retrotrans gag domain-containing protein [Abeliophyllum distichum]|uniref:Retrotrans gag domain-containing protein n=1 Tax=Abeliophyllum distichum TaxID=126358 RepID=A0ABD1V7D2_9LAMI
MFDRLGVGSSTIQPQSLSSPRSEKSEARLERKSDSRAVNVKPKEEKPEWSWDLDDDDENLSFSKKPKARELPNSFKIPHMEKYNGRGDPTYHINVYKTRLQGYISAVKFKNFHTTLISDAKRWFNKMTPESIRSCPQLK